MLCTMCNITELIHLSIFLSEGFEEKEVKEKPVKAKKKPGKILVQPILLDNTGRPVFPIELGPLTIYSLGEVGLH